METHSSILAWRIPWTEEPGGLHSPFSSVQFSSVAQSCPTPCDPRNRSTPGLPVHHQLPEFTQTHVQWVGDAIQPSHPRSSPFPPALNPSQHQSLFQWVNSSHEVAKVLDFQTISVSLFLTLTEVRRYYLRKQKLQIRGQEILAESQGNLTQTWIKGQILGQWEISYFFH